MTSFANRGIEAAFAGVPDEARVVLLELRELILAVGRKVGEIGGVEESLKWGEPSYATHCGSAVRLGWKAVEPNRCRVLFHCQTRLVSTFRRLYPDVFVFEGNRAIVFEVGKGIPREQLGYCVELALTYHRRKDKPLLGAETR